MKNNSAIDIEMLPVSELSSVVFILDYVQLIFQNDYSFNIYNDISWTSGDICLTRGDVGFCDAVVALIGQRINSAAVDGNQQLQLRFHNGAVLQSLPLKNEQNWAEAWQFNTAGSLDLVVGQN